MMKAIIAIVAGLVVAGYGVLIYLNLWDITGRWYRWIVRFWRNGYYLPFSKNPANVDDLRKFILFTSFPFGIILVIMGIIGIIRIR